MNQYKILNSTADQVSDSRKKIIYLSVLGELIVTLHLLIAQTRKMLALRRFRQVYSCMDIVNRIYESGNGPQRAAVETEYINSLPSLRKSCTKTEWNLVKTMMPRSIYKAYVRELESEEDSSVAS